MCLGTWFVAGSLGQLVPENAFFTDSSTKLNGETELDGRNQNSGLVRLPTSRTVRVESLLNATDSSPWCRAKVSSPLSAVCRCCFFPPQRNPNRIYVGSLHYELKESDIT